ncbi:MAG: hypothetical protein ACO1SX_07390, partial [Actinomycetota bacterium]
MNRIDSFRVFETNADERLASYCDHLTRPAPVRASTKQKWIQQRGALRESLLQSLGLNPLPERLPVDPKMGEPMDGDGYRLQRIRWRAWPEVRSTGWLCAPVGVEGARPAVLCFFNDATAPDARRFLISMARLGIVAMSIDPVDVVDPSIGITPYTVSTWGAMRALDYLAGRADVDRDRLGVLGAAGGAQAAAVLMAADDRPRVFVLESAQFDSDPRPAPGASVTPYGLHRFIGWPGVYAIPSPRALLFLTSGPDGEAVDQEDGLAELLAIYRLWQQPDRLAHQHLTTAGGFDQAVREAAYTWFVRELRGDRKSPPVAEPEWLPSDAHVEEATEDSTAAHELLGWFRKRVPAQPPQIESKQSRRSYQDRVRDDLRTLLGADQPITLAPWFDSPESKPGSDGADSEDRSTRRIQRLSLRSEWGVRVPAIWVPGSGDAPWRVVIALHPSGKSVALRTPLVRGLQREGYAVLAPDLRFQGEQALLAAPDTAAWGRPVAGMAVTDVQACIEWLSGRADVDPRWLTIAGKGAYGVVALLAGGLDERVSVTVADCAETTYRDGGEGLPVIPNVLRVADVPQIASLVG